MAIWVSRIRSSNARLATGLRLPSMTTAVSTKLTADKRRVVAAARACANAVASGSARRIATSAELSTIIDQTMRQTVLVIEEFVDVAGAERLLELRRTIASDRQDPFRQAGALALHPLEAFAKRL